MDINPVQAADGGAAPEAPANEHAEPLGNAGGHGHGH